jgi:hypothetical protein
MIEYDRLGQPATPDPETQAESVIEDAASRIDADVAANAVRIASVVVWLVDEATESDTPAIVDALLTDEGDERILDILDAAAIAALSALAEMMIARFKT